MLMEATLRQLDPEQLAKRWRERARCRVFDVEMVPGDEGSQGEPVEVRRAKGVCQPCPVKAECLGASGDRRMSQPGVWGGLTLAEREILRVSRLRGGPGRTVETCSKCHLDCIPRAIGSGVCDVCAEEAQLPRTPAEVRAQIEELVDKEWSYQEIADLFGLSKSAISNACQRWGLKSKAPARTAELKPCGTQAAKVRHRRAGADMSKLTCACARPIPVRPPERSAIPQEVAA